MSEEKFNVEDFHNRILEKSRQRYVAGDNSQILPAISYCISHHHPFPEWLAQAFEAARDAARTYKIKSWDEVFGKPLPKGKHLKTARRDYELAEPIFTRVCDLQKTGRALEPDLFAEVGKEFDIGGTKAREIYYDVLRDATADDD